MKWGRTDIAVAVLLVYAARLVFLFIDFTWYTPDDAKFGNVGLFFGLWVFLPVLICLGVCGIHLRRRRSGARAEGIALFTLAGTLGFCFGVYGDWTFTVFALSVLGLWVLLSDQSRREFRSASEIEWDGDKLNLPW